MYKFKFADIGEGLHEGVVAEIYKKEGEIVKEGDSLFSVETDKVTSDIPSPADGKIAKILMAQGDTIHVGDVIYHIDDGGGTLPIEKPSVNVKVEATTPEAHVNVVEVKPSTTSASISSNMTKRMIHINKILGKTVVSNESLTNSTPKENKSIINSNEKHISPLARAIAKDHNLDVSLIVGTGINNKIMQADVWNIIKNKSQTTTALNSSPQITGNEKTIVGDRRVKVTNLRKTIAKVMKNSWDTVAYTNLFTEIDMTKLWEFRAKAKDKIFKQTGIKITFLAFIIKALSISIKKYPNMNATYDDKTSELVLKGSFNAGIAVDTKAGLVVPVIKNADQISILAIAGEIIRLGGLARDGKLKMSDMSGGTFSITNYGSFGALAGVPVINYPELALAGVGGIVDKVSIINGQISPRKSMLLTVAADHRWIDGGDIAKFARDVKELLEEPAMLWIDKEINNV